MMNRSQSSLFGDPVFKRFATERPIATVCQMALRRLLEPDTVDRVFRENAGEQYERSLLFSGLTHLISSVVLGKQASVNAGFKKMKDKLGVSLNAVYEKLKRVEPNTSRHLLRESYARTIEVRQQIGGIARHDLPGYTTRILDGNCISASEHRLSETRAIRAAPLPGKSLVVYDPRHDAVVDFFPIEDGHAQERTAFDEVIETLERNQLWIADRNFCTLKLMYSIARQGGVFLIRHHKNLHGSEKGKLKKIGETETGIVYENKLELPTHDGETITVRRVLIHLYEETRDGEVELVLLTNLPSEDGDALAVSELYRTRWKIETAFLHMTVAMNCEINALCYPKAALFCFANALIAYNALSIVKGTIAVEHGRDQSEMLSHWYMLREIAETTDGMLIALPEECWGDVATMSTKQFADELSSISRDIDMKIYRKSVRGKKKPPPKKKGNKRTVHVSTKRILDKRKENSY